MGEWCGPKLNCESIAPRNVGWAGLTTGEMMLALMQTAHEFTETRSLPPWEYFILIGHESVPLTSLRYVEGYLARAYPLGTNFINCWKVSGYDFFGQWEDNNWRLEGMVVEDFRGTTMKYNLLDTTS
jgi:hypothetical protein